MSTTLAKSSSGRMPASRSSRSSPASLSSLWSHARGAAATLLVALSTVTATVISTFTAAVLTVALATACASRGAASAGDELRELAQFLDEVHPRPHAFVEAAVLAALVDDEARRLDALPEDKGDPLLARANQLAFGLGVHRVLARLGDGHLAVALPIFQPGQPGQPGQPEQPGQPSQPALPLLPVLPKLVGAAVYVDAATAPLPRGTELLAIDGVAIAEIWSTLSELVLVDAGHPVARRAALERGFARHYHLAYGLRQSYALDVRLPDGELRSLSLAGVERDTLAALAAARHSAPLWGAQVSAPGEPPWPALTRIDATTVLLRLPSFGLADEAGYAQRVDEIFAQLFAAQPPPGAADTLILDLRGNEGGLRTHGLAVLSRLVAAPYAQWAQMAARLLRIPEAHRARVDFGAVPEAALAERFAAAPMQDGRYVFSGDPLAARMQPRPPRYPGRVVAFVDGATASAAAELLAALRASVPGALFIGEESGSECRGHVGELPVTYRTASGVIVLVSLIELTHVATAGCQVGHGFAPDVAISYDLAAFLAGRDPYLDAVAQLRR